MESIKIKPSKLQGKVNVPPSKSLSHRAIICASLSENESTINNLILSEDIKATIEGMRKLGSAISIKDKSAIIKHSSTMEKDIVIDCNESGSTLRFLIPISIVLNNKCNFTGSQQLFQRPLDIYFDIFEKQNIEYYLKEIYPLSIKGKLSPSTFRIPGNISSQFISGLLFSLPLLKGDSEIVITDKLESKSYVQMTIDVMKRFGINISLIDNKTFHIKGTQKYKNTCYTVESDFSQAAFFLVANKLGSEVSCLGLNEDSLQGDKEIIKIIKRYDESNDVIIDASQIPDLVPIIAVLACLMKNHTTIIKNAQRLRIKECDRLKAISTELNKLGALIKEADDGLIIEGKESLKGGIVNSWNDHRIAMALAIASTKCDDIVIIEDHKAVNKSYPDFWKDFKSLGGDTVEFNNRS